MNTKIQLIILFLALIGVGRADEASKEVVITSKEAALEAIDLFLGQNGDEPDRGLLTTLRQLLGSWQDDASPPDCRAEDLRPMKETCELLELGSEESLQHKTGITAINWVKERFTECDSLFSERFQAQLEPSEVLKRLANFYRQHVGIGNFWYSLFLGNFRMKGRFFFKSLESKDAKVTFGQYVKDNLLEPCEAYPVIDESVLNYMRLAKSGIRISTRRYDDLLGAVDVCEQVRSKGLEGIRKEVLKGYNKMDWARANESNWRSDLSLFWNLLIWNTVDAD